MRLVVVMLICLVFFPSSSTAIEVFHKYWKEHYLEDSDASETFIKSAKRTGCYVCHEKGSSKKTVRNEYGIALERYLQASDFPEEWVKANPQKAKEKIVAALKKVEEALSKDRESFGDKIRRGVLPAIDSKMRAR